MVLILTYLILALIGNVAIYFIGLMVERMWPAASLLTYLMMFFAVLWVSWILAVKITAPKDAAKA
jgi:cation transporter-like permease